MSVIPAAVDLFVDHVTHIDCGVLDRVHGLRGATWLVDAVLSGERDAQGMLFDFGPAKKLLKAKIDALVDHRLLVPTRAAGLRCRADGVQLTTAQGDVLDYTAPASAMTRLDCEQITPEYLAGWLGERVAARLPANIHGLRLTLRPEAIEGPVYDYTHGLSAHDGNCQRLAHGHRCRLAVTVGGAERPDLAGAWADAWQGVFVGTRTHLVSAADASRLAFAYDAPQGHFAIELAAERCVIIDGPATVENIADHIAQTLALRYPGQSIAVRAYEGVGKGAIATRRPAIERPTSA